MESVHVPHQREISIIVIAEARGKSTQHEASPPVLAGSHVPSSGHHYPRWASQQWRFDLEPPRPAAAGASSLAAAAAAAVEVDAVRAPTAVRGATFRSSPPLQLVEVDHAEEGIAARAAVVFPIVRPTCGGPRETS